MKATTTRSVTCSRHFPLAVLPVLAAAACMLWAPLDAGADSSRTQRPAKDRGEASMRIGEAGWQARGANARLRGNTLSVSAMRFHRVEAAVITERLSLRIPDYQGPGHYAAATGSNFVRAGVSIPQDADDSTQAASAVLANALKGARMIRLDNAETLDLVAFRDAVSSMSGGSAPTPTALPAPASQEDHASLRGWLDSQRDVVLGCTGSDLAIVTIEPAETAARIALRPPFAGTAEEECVRSALGAPPSVPSGRVIHALRATP